jgi:hypothetical protein
MRDQQGMSLSPFVVGVLPALLIMIGLVVDGGAQSAAQRQAEGLAAAAARAAADDTAAARLAGGTVDVAHAIARAQAVIATRPGVAAEVTVDDGRVRVHTRASVPTVLLSLIGVDELQAHGSAEADLVGDR